MRRAASRSTTSAALATLLWLALGCAGWPGRAPLEAQRCWPSFPYQQGWLGGDGAYSVPLPGARSLWLFGDTFVGAPGQRDRAGAHFVHNSVGISSCGADGRFAIEYFWGAGAEPRAFLERDEGWWWLNGGFLHGGALYLVMLGVESAPPHGPLNVPFRFTGSALGRVADPAGDPTQWRVEVLPLSDGSRALPVSAAVVHGAHLHLFAFVAEADGGSPRFLARLPLARLAAPAAALETLARDGRWLPGLVPEHARILMGDDATEMSVRHEPASGRWIAVYNHPDVRGTFPDVTPSDAVHARTADRLEGPWSEPELIFRIPELDPSRRSDRNVGCYAAKEQAQFSLPGALTFTYVCNLFSGRGEDPYAILERLQRRMDLYRPVAASVTLPAGAPAGAGR
jgi:hypothetical protein